MTMKDFTLRVCRYGDLERVLALERIAFADSAYTRFDFVYFLGWARSGFTVATKDDLILGYVIALGKEGAGMIQSIAVSPEFREKGIGAALMRFAVDYLCRYEQIYLLVDPNNAAAISLYRRFSFTETGRISRWYYRNGHDAIEMVRTRAAPGNQTAVQERAQMTKQESLGLPSRLGFNAPPARTILILRSVIGASIGNGLNMHLRILPS